MKRYFLQSVIIEQQIDQKKEINESKTEQKNENNDNEMFDGWYSEDEHSPVKLNIANLRHFKVNFDQIISQKEARLKTEEKRPFIVAKRGKHKRRLDKEDTIYYTKPKMNFEYNKATRVGFLMADKNFKEVRYKEKNKNKYNGICNEEFLILKNKKRNTKKIGYLQLLSDGDTEYYVEVIRKIGYKWLFILFGIIIAICVLINAADKNNWNFNTKNLTFYKTKEVTNYTETTLELSVNAVSICRDNKLNVNMTTKEVDDITFDVEMYIGNKLIYQRKDLKAGEGLDNIQLNDEMEPGNYFCTLNCDYYKNKNYRGTLETNFTIRVVQ